MIENDWLTYVRQKSKSTATCPFYVDGPAWFQANADLARCMELEPKHVTLFTTQHGKPKSHKSAAHWFSKACRETGLSESKTAHGIRKGRAAMFKENGATADQRMAIPDYKTEKEAARYSASADLQKTVWGTEKFQLEAKVPTRTHNLLANKE